MIQPPWASGVSVRADSERTVSKHGRARQVASTVRPIDAGGSREGTEELPASERWRPLGEMCDLEGCGSVMYESGMLDRYAAVSATPAGRARNRWPRDAVRHSRLPRSRRNASSSPR